MENAGVVGGGVGGELGGGVGCELGDGVGGELGGGVGGDVGGGEGGGCTGGDSVGRKGGGKGWGSAGGNAGGGTGDGEAGGKDGGGDGEGGSVEQTNARAPAQLPAPTEERTRDVSRAGISACSQRDEHTGREQSRSSACERSRVGSPVADPTTTSTVTRRSQRSLPSDAACERER
jgi:hypothetical protein